LQGIESLAGKISQWFSQEKNGFGVWTVDENKAAALHRVVNRKVDEVHKTIYFHTDNRSRKYIDLIKDNRFHCCFMTHGNEFKLL
jgi:general stress protein 26